MFSMTSATTSVQSSLDPSRWRSLAVILLASFMVLLDTSIVTNGLATIQKDLDATYAEVQFVLTAYTIAYGMMLITGGRLGDLYGRKRVFMLGLAGFTLTSALCGLAWSPFTLILFRVLQGLTAGIMFPQVSSIIQVIFPVSERPRAFGLQGAIVGLGIVTGPLLGGVLIDANLFGSSWRPIFLVNIPIGILALLLAARVLPESRSPAARNLDLLGVVMISVAMFLLTYPIIQGRDEGWATWIVALLAASLPVLGVFIAYQRNLIAKRKAPLVQLELFRDRAFLIGSLITFVFQSGVLSYFVAMSIFLQGGLGFSPATSAVRLMAYQIAIVAGSLLSARLSAVLGRSVLTLGVVLLTLGLIGTMLILQATALEYRGYELIPALLVGGLGFGFVIAPLQSIILARINPSFAGSASGVLSTIQQIGSAIGVAVIGVLFFGQLASQANTSSAAVTPKLVQSLQAAQIPQPQIAAISQQFQTCFHDRSFQADPNAIPASCHSGVGLPKAVGAALESAATQARKQNFLAALLLAFRFQLVVYALCFALIFWLPNTNQRRTA
jgi:EmrB/QacA subfamily drug resistance transporter